MIRYTLKCEQAHEFDGWFASAEAYDRQRAAGQVTCAICGSGEVQKSLMAPAVRSGKAAPALDAPSPPQPDTAATAPARPLSAPGSEMERAFAKMRAELEAKTVDVGKDFVREARAMHEGAAPERAIRGEAKLEDAKALLEEGVPILPLPFSTRKVN